MVFGGCVSMKCMVVVMCFGGCSVFLLMFGKWLSRNGVCILFVMIVDMCMLFGCSLVCSVCDRLSRFYFVV